MTMYGGTISGNTTENEGGGVNAITMIMHGGTISGNSAKSGGGVCTDYMTMTGGTIKENKVTNPLYFGGGVRVYDDMMVSGNAQIINNTRANGEPDNLAADKILLADSLGDDAAIGVSVDTLQPGQSVVYMEAAEGKTVSAADMAKTFSDDGYAQRIRNGAAEMYVAGVYVKAQPAAWGTASGGGAYKPGDTVTLTAEATSEGFGFAGWYQGDTLVSTENPYVFTLEKETEEFTAKFEIIEYTLTYHLNGGKYPEGSEGNPATYDVKTRAFTLVNPEKENCIFLSWEENGELKETVEIKHGSTGDRVFTAKWATYSTPIGDRYSVYSVTHYQEQPDGSYAEVTADTQFPLQGLVGTTVSAGAKTYAGYTFNAAKSTTEAEIIEAAPGADGQPAYTKLALYYDLNEYTITFNAAGGSKVAPVTQKYRTAVSAPANPTKEGYLFAGWADENGNIVSFPMDMPLGGMRLTAVWKIPKLPKTGDDSSAALWMLLMGMAGAAWLALRRRAQN